MPEEVPRPSRLKALHQALVGLLWTGTLLVVCAWIFHWPLPIRAEPEPLAALMGMISTAVTWLYGVAAQRFEQNRRALESTRAELEVERYSLSHALAYGYVHNFLEPAVTHLLEQAGSRANSVQFYIYLPSELSELEPDAIKRTVARIRALGFETRSVPLELNRGRPRDVLTLLGNSGGGASEPRYFDFPTTLLTLRQLVDFRLGAQPDQAPDDARRELGRTYIAVFRAELERYLREKDLARHVLLVDRELIPLAVPPQAPGSFPTPS